jgi:hypothetical protein
MSVTLNMVDALLTSKAMLIDVHELSQIVVCIGDDLEVKVLLVPLVVLILWVLGRDGLLWLQILSCDAREARGN